MSIRWTHSAAFCRTVNQLILLTLVVVQQGTSKNVPLIVPSGSQSPEIISRAPGDVLNDGRLNLVLQVYLSKLSDDMRMDQDLSFSSKQTDFLLHRLRGLYNHLKDHPALMDSRLAVSSHRPDLDSGDTSDNEAHIDTATDHEPSTLVVTKRKLDLPLTEACASITEWISINKSRDIHDQEVEIFQPNGGEEEAQLGAQFFYTTRCVNGVENQPCTGTSFLYNSKCLTRRGYVMALVRKKADDAFDWNWIQVPVSCNCAVSQKF